MPSSVKIHVLSNSLLRVQISGTQMEFSFRDRYSGMEDRLPILRAIADLSQVYPQH